MSVALMAECFKTSAPATAKLVLLALCDCANDQGECFPGVPLLMQKCSLTDRAVQKTIVELERFGFLKRQMRPGRSTTYQVTPAGGVWEATPEPRSPPNPRTTFTPEPRSPRTTFTTPPNVVHPTPEPRSPITIKEPSVKQKTAAQAPEFVTAEELVSDGLDVETASEWIAHRTRKRARLTPKAWKGIKSEAQKAGWPLQQAIEKALARGWQSFDAEFVKGEKPAANNFAGCI